MHIDILNTIGLYSNHIFTLDNGRLDMQPRYLLRYYTLVFNDDGSYYTIPCRTS